MIVKIKSNVINIRPLKFGSRGIGDSIESFNREKTNGSEPADALWCLCLLLFDETQGALARQARDSK